MLSTTHLCASSALATLLALTPHVQAAQANAADAADAANAADAQASRSGAPAAAAPRAAPDYVPGFGLAAAPARLDSSRGGSDGMATSANLRGAVTGNRASNVVTGANTIQASSFAGATGIPIVIQNSGANVLIQNATIINLQFRQ